MRSQSFFLRAKILDIKTGYPWIAVVHEKDVYRYGLRAGNQLSLRWREKKTIITIDVTSTLVKPGEIGLFLEIIKHYEIKPGELLELSVPGKPDSIRAIQKKLLGKKLSYREIYSIIFDIVNHRLGEVEIAFFVASAFGKRQFSREEIYYLTKAMAETGKVFNFGKLVVDKHSTGGLPGNRVTPIVVAIVASYGICIPKTSSRAVTSAAGTADTFEVIAPVTFKSEEVEKIIKKVGACLIWGAEKIAPADEKIIRVSYGLFLEPYTKMVVSIMAKKVAMGVRYLVLDIPVGPTTKIPHLKQALMVKRLFSYLARRFGIKIRILIHRAKGPVGQGIGPALEARDILRVLQQKSNRPRDLEEKSIWLAGNLLELIGKAKKGTGSYLARKALVNGNAWKKMQEIIKAQGGNQNIDSEEVRLGSFTFSVKSKTEGRITSIHNKNLVEICRLLGAPENKKAGIYLEKRVGERVKKGEKLFTLFTSSRILLNLALEALKKIGIYKIKPL